MPCYQSTSLPSGVTTTGRTSYKTEADCLNACKEGACCEGTTCTVKPQCQCQGTGKVFNGVGTTCATNPCNVPCCTGENISCRTDLTEASCIAAGGVVQNVPCSQTGNACCIYYYTLRPTLKGSCCRNVPVYGSGMLSQTIVGYRCSTLTLSECNSIGGSFCAQCSSGSNPAGSDQYGDFFICSNPLP
jgi:hypothetical protein